MTNFTAQERVMRGLGLAEKELEGLSDQERAILITCLEEFMDEGGSPTAATLLLEDYRWQPVSMEQFLNDPFYFGTLGTNLYPAVKGLLVEVFDSQQRCTEVILGGAIGWGKTTGAAIVILYIIYRLSCLRDPHKFYGKVTGSKIYIAIYSVSIDQAEDSSFAKLRKWIDEIPYFRERCPRQARISTKIVFVDSPVEVITGSKEVHAIGRDVFAFMLDEANFLTAATGKGKDNPGMAYKIYTGARNRLKSRFKDGGGEIAGMVLLVSSKRSRASFLETHTRDSQKEIKSKQTRLYSFSQWEVQPASNFTKPRFQVEIGDRIHPSRILRDGEGGRAGAEVINVPGEFRQDFEMDVEGALRDIAGVASEGILPLVHDRSCLDRCANAIHKHPFSRQSVVLDLLNDVTLDQYFLQSLVFAVRRSEHVLRLNPNCPRYVHIDIGLTGDALGIACLHLSGFKTVVRRRADSSLYEDKAPIATVDFMLQVLPPENSEIDLGKVRGFLMNLRNLGMPIQRVSYDSYQSRGEVQTFRKLGFDAVTYSVDRTDEAYMALRSALVEERICYYDYPVFKQEVSDLERDVDNRKVDHPATSPITGLPGCFTGDTRVSLLDGREVTLQELAERRSAGPVYVYTVRDGRVSVGVGRSPRLTARMVTVVAVTLDNDQVVRCTPDHRFMLRDGSYRAAADLRPGDSLMPLYRQVTPHTAELPGYELHSCPFDGSWHYTHRTVGRWKYGRVGRGVLHHAAGKLNNDPDQIVRMSGSAHSRLHAVELMRMRRGDVDGFESRRVAGLAEFNASPVTKVRAARRMRVLNADPRHQAEHRLRASMIGKRTGPENLTRYNRSDAARAKASEVGKVTIRRAQAALVGRDRDWMRGSRNHQARSDVTMERLRGMVHLSLDQVCAALGCTDKVVSRVLKAAGYGGWRGFTGRGRTELGPRNYAAIRYAAPRNHKVVSVAPAGCADVYDLTVEGTENFFLSAGVAVHNSKDVSDAVAGAYFNAIIDKRLTVAGVHNAKPGDRLDYAVQVADTVDVPWHELEREVRR